MRRLSPWLRWLCGWVLLLVAGYAALAVLVMLRQRTLYYHPARISAEVLTAFAKQRAMLPWTNAAGLRIGWQRLSHLQPASGAALILHGNGGTAVGREYITDPLQAALPLDVFILEYPGYADRPGEPTQVSFLAAADEAFLQLTNRAPLYLVTESIGTGPGAWLAGKYPQCITGLCDLVPYNNLTAVAQRRMPWLPVGLLLWDRYPADEWLKNYHGPMAVCVGENDLTIAPELGRALYDGYVGPKKFWLLPGQGHMEAPTRPVEWWREVGEFWRSQNK